MCFGLFLLDILPLVYGPYSILSSKNDSSFSRSPNEGRFTHHSCLLSQHIAYHKVLVDEESDLNNSWKPTCNV